MAKEQPDWASPLKSSLPTTHPLPPHNPRGKRNLPRWLTLALAGAALYSLYLQFIPGDSPHEPVDRTLLRFYRHVQAQAGRAGPSCPHARMTEQKPPTKEEVEHTLLTVPSAESARNASHLYTARTHVAGTEGDHALALLLKKQWSTLLGLPEPKHEENAWDAGTDEDYEALTGEKKHKKKGDGKKEHKHGKHHKKGLKYKARKVLRRAGLPVPPFLRSHKHQHRGKRGRSPPSLLDRPRVWTSAYYPLLNYPLSSSLTYTPSSSNPNGEEPLKARLEENVLEKDKTSGEGVLPWHGLSGNGTARGRLVYASKGSPRDFEELAERGIDVRGAVVIVQYGGLFRGLKIKAAAERGAKAVLIYTDPVEDGEVTLENGYEAYPEGPAREPSSIQRGSAQYLSLYPGDPLTPSLPAYNPSLPHSPPRLPRSSPSVNIPSIPSLPLSYEDAVPFLRLLNGKGVRLEDVREGKPEGWREGGLGGRGVEYWTGPSEGEVEVVNSVEEKVTAIWNTYALIPGHISDEVVVLGNHHDAWGFGAGDPSSGTAAVHEIVCTLGALRRKGWRPLRTVLVAGWDGEEYGLIGSTEFGEDFSSWLKERVVAYLNVDVAAAGTEYELAASPSIAGLLREVSAKVEDPDREGFSLAEAHSREAREAKGQVVGNEEQRKVMEAGGEGELEVSALGSGSDFTVFLQRLGLASLNAGYARNGKDPVYHYHSNYDSAYWQDHFGDPHFKHHETIAKVLALATVRLADDAVLPINTTAYAEALGEYVDKVSHLDGAASLSLSRLRALSLSILSASSSLHSRASSIASRLSSPDAGAKLGRKEALKLVKELKELNGRIRRFEGGFLGDEEGLKGREWYKHLGVAPGRWLGYGATTLPGLTEALTLDHDPAQAADEVVRLEKAFEGVLRGLKGE
ncbi:hypothetical protein JCM8547_008190 [Rhodosporidiobolus lusitaniae]